ncbi:MAG: hypothetical protein IJS53_00350 [Clostridia bacterium]|nr:hypothetical protein [Clostridia bacterium]
MKRIAAFILALTLLTGALALTASAGELDYSYIEQYSDAFGIEVDDAGDAFIYLNYNYPTFRHEYSPEQYSSLMYSDILVLYYYSDAIPVWRIWIETLSEVTLGITAVSFELDGVVYTFDMADSVVADTLYGYDYEQCAIVMGAVNCEFWLNLMARLEELGSLDAFETVQIPVTLHGAAGDLTFDMPTDSLIFIYFMGEAMVNLGDIDCMYAVNGSPLLGAE